MSNSKEIRNGTEKNSYTGSPYTNTPYINSPYMKIGERIGQLRKQAGLKQEELGHAVGVTTQAACDLMWNIQKAVLRCEDSNIDRVAVSNILDAATQKSQSPNAQSQKSEYEHDERNEHKKNACRTAEDSDASISTSGLYIETDSGYMSYGFNDLDYIFLLSQPENGFESVVKDADSLRRLFSLLVKPYCLEVIAALYAKKPNENVTGRLLAKELNAPETEVIAVLDELCNYRLIRNLEITDTNGKMHIYSYENSAEWVAFLTFASMLMYTENEARLAVNMRKRSAFSAPFGSKNPFASWNRRNDDKERINLYRAGNE